jgi:hypothetical protein
MFAASSIQIQTCPVALKRSTRPLSALLDAKSRHRRIVKTDLVIGCLGHRIQNDPLSTWSDCSVRAAPVNLAFSVMIPMAFVSFHS